MNDFAKYLKRNEHAFVLLEYRDLLNLMLVCLASPALEGVDNLPSAVSAYFHQPTTHPIRARVAEVDGGPEHR